jgi:hypothetical protein
MADQKTPIDAAKVREQLQKIAGVAGSLDDAALADVSGGGIIDVNVTCISDCSGKKKPAQQ